MLGERRGTMRELRIGWPLLVHIGAGVGEHAPVPLRVKPGHGEGAGRAGADAHGRAALRIGRQPDGKLRLDRR